MKKGDYAAKYDSLAAESALYDIPFRKEYLLSNIGRGKRVLDVGCLGGQISKLIQDNNNDVWGVEINPSAAKAAEARGIKVKVADVEEGLPFDTDSFDAVNAGEVIEHLYDTKYFFSEAARVLKTGGVFLFTTPNLNSLENRVRVATGGYLAMAGAYPEDHFGDHIRQFNLGKIRELCAQTGFEVEDVRGVPAMKTKGKWVDLSLSVFGRVAPGLSKLLIVRARKTRAI